jgi:hypothetical protein
MTGREVLERWKRAPVRFAGEVRLPPPPFLLGIGTLVRIEYDPFEGSPQGRYRYWHPFDNPPRLYVGPHGRGLFVPDARFTAHGFKG